MAMTMIEKILARKSGQGRVSAGDTVVCDVDMTVMIDLQFATSWVQPLRINDPAKVAVVMDHAVPAPSVSDAAGGTRARAFARDFAVEKFYDVGRHGICHQVIAENGLARPGEILACTDSHTCAAGAYNTAARGLGPAEVYSILCTGKTWFQVAPTIRYEFTGTKPDAVSGKDVFLHIAGTFGDATNHNLEFGGPGLASLPMNDRRTIATQGAEISADFSTFPIDDLAAAFLSAHGAHPDSYQAAEADPDAVYAAVRGIDMSALEPYVARPGTVSHNAVPVSAIEQRPVQQCFIGSCANGQLEDIAVAAAVVRGRTVAPGVRLLVTPASQQVYRDAMRAGYLQDLADAGAVVTNSTCGACFGYHMGLLGPGEVCLTSSTRNFTGRMGSPDAEIYMASPATVAASALTGRVTDPRTIDTRTIDRLGAQN
ncbi:3-isopropylmalate dehydratase large subunit [Streptacidiphilus fuscans]|uniref:3-isopropylmalate dehydratase large subunit n=1 Tax=Streptacidiphilus fuscans TaxID=2789292 RepID=A0A931AW08_9ACTN|nr:aconitase/3-isopropylmalate dehydratase large subunit family protein [Streptacidiphilus fuscans]MBF9066505.1 3-isopropylmalate dehydratase large subunit [Streptacidiphilus fuscans]